MARARKKGKRKAKGVVGKHRLNLRIDEDLVEFAKGYAERRGTTITQIIVGHLRRLRDREPSQF